jgi:hypothetical protein
MRSRSLIALGLATALGGVPSFASAADAALPGASAVDPMAVLIAVGAASAALAAGIVLAARRRRPPAEPGGGATEAARAIEAADDEVTAALQRRTLRRGRIRVDDELAAGNARPTRPAG